MLNDDNISAVFFSKMKTYEGNLTNTYALKWMNERIMKHNKVNWKLEMHTLYSRSTPLTTMAVENSIKFRTNGGGGVRVEIFKK